MGLRRDRKGMIAMMDAMILIILLSAATTWLFVFNETDDIEEPMAKTVSDDLFMIEVKTNDLTGLGDTKVLPIETLIASTMNSGDTERTERFIRSTLDALIPEVYGYELILEYNGHSMRFSRGGSGQMSSEYSSKHIIDGAGVLTSHMIIY